MGIEDINSVEARMAHEIKSRLPKTTTGPTMVSMDADRIKIKIGGVRSAARTLEAISRAFDVLRREIPDLAGVDVFLSRSVPSGQQ